MVLSIQLQLLKLQPSSHFLFTDLGLRKGWNG